MAVALHSQQGITDPFCDALRRAQEHRGALGVADSYLGCCQPVETQDHGLGKVPVAHALDHAPEPGCCPFVLTEFEFRRSEVGDHTGEFPWIADRLELLERLDEQRARAGEVLSVERDVSEISQADAEKPAVADSPRQIGAFLEQAVEGRHVVGAVCG